MYIDDLVQYCYSSYSRPERCPDCQNTNCPGNCELCLNEIHFQGGNRKYDCENLAYYYTCKYIYKYSSEIDRLLARFARLRSFNEYNVLSIGCGPCTELAGLLNFLERTGRNRQVNFVGIDTNKIWQPIHKIIPNISTQGNYGLTTRFFYGDAVRLKRLLDLQTIKWRPNILILQYCLSSMIKDGANMVDFRNELASEIIPHMPLDSCIIINDINHSTKARNEFGRLQNSINQQIQTDVNMLHFEIRGKPYYHYGEQHTTNTITSSISSQIQSMCDPHKHCGSAQMVLQRK